MSKSGIGVYGDISVEELRDIIAKALPDRNVYIQQNGESKLENGFSNGISLSMIDSSKEQALLNKLEAKEKEMREIEENSHKATLSIQAIHKQQQALYDEFVLLRQRYDEQKTALVAILWTHCCKYHPDLRQIPQVEDEATFLETDEKVGNLTIGAALGEGQFATVKLCLRDGGDREYALKIIKKERITSFTSLMRVSNEIENLKLLKSPYIVTVVQVIHTATRLYIVTEKGGYDLFEFFDEHADGVPEKWAKEIMVCILKATLYCHEQGICHRDMKPENILLDFDTKEERCVDLKLCDFGLSTKFKPKVMLTDFCGSPGFFAPEMIINGAYYGDKADVWSVGCILLELVVGHEKFCDVWMTAYDYEILQDKNSFTEAIEETVNVLPDVLNFSDDLNDFILRFLQLRSTKRPNIRGVCAHPWLEGLMDEELSSLRASKLSFDAGSRPWSPPGLSPGSSFLIDPADAPQHVVSPEELKAAYNNLSEKERRQMEEYILSHKNEADNNHMRLPPITPQTPNIGHARKIIRKGNELANANTGAHAAPNGTAAAAPDNGFHTPTSGKGMFSPYGAHPNSGKSSFSARSPLPGVLESTEYDGVELSNSGPFSPAPASQQRHSQDSLMQSASGIAATPPLTLNSPMKNVLFASTSEKQIMFDTPK